MAGRTVMLIAFSVTLTAASALATDPPAPAGKQQLICRGGARQLGSHMRTPRRCRTAEQWQEENEAKANLPVSLQVTQGQNDGRAVPTPQ